MNHISSTRNERVQNLVLLYVQGGPRNALCDNHQPPHTKTDRSLEFSTPKAEMENDKWEFRVSIPQRRVVVEFIVVTGTLMGRGISTAQGMSYLLASNIILDYR